MQRNLRFFIDINNIYHLNFMFCHSHTGFNAQRIYQATVQLLDKTVSFSHRHSDSRNSISGFFTNTWGFIRNSNSYPYKFLITLSLKLQIYYDTFLTFYVVRQYRPASNLTWISRTSWSSESNDRRFITRQTLLSGAKFCRKLRTRQWSRHGWTEYELYHDISQNSCT